MRRTGYHDIRKCLTRGVTRLYGQWDTELGELSSCQGKLSLANEIVLMETMYTFTVYGSNKAFSPVSKWGYGAATPFLENGPSPYHSLLAGFAISSEVVLLLNYS